MDSQGDLQQGFRIEAAGNSRGKPGLISCFFAILTVEVVATPNHKIRLHPIRRS